MSAIPRRARVTVYSKSIIKLVSLRSQMSARFVPCIEHCDEANGLLLPAATTEERSNHSITHTGRLNPRITFCSRRRPPVEGKILVLKQFVKKYRSLFPLCVSVAQGYCNPELGYEVTAGELYMLILTRTMKWIVVADRCGKQKLIPMNSHVEYTFLYNPDGDLERAKRGYILPTVRDILDRRTRPYVIRATRGYEGDTEEDSVEQSEVLIVLKQKRRGFGDSSLSVYSVTLGMTKLLPSHCLGDFSTNPYATKLRITEILGHIDMSFPAKVCLFIVPEFDKEIDPCLLENPMDVLGLRSTKSVLANLVSSHDNALETYDPNNQPLEIPLYLPITVSVHSHKPADSDSHTARLVPLVFETPNLKTETLDTDLSERPYQFLNETYGKDSDTLYEVAGPRATYTTRNLSSEIIHGVRVLEKSLKVSFRRSTYAGWVSTKERNAFK